MLILLVVYYALYEFHLNIWNRKISIFKDSMHIIDDIGIAYIAICQFIKVLVVLKC